jgi:SynChlorMet cassette protein ScmC
MRIIMNVSAAEMNGPVSAKLSLGPLKYQLVAHDAWGEGLLGDLNAHLDLSAGMNDLPDRIIHLCSLPQGAGDRKEERTLTEQLESWLPDGDRGRRWSYCRNLVNTVWSSAESRHGFWTAGIDSGLGRFRYHLPWDMILYDMRRQGGGLIHGGLAVHEGAALLLLAPPGGGKTTTLASAPADWQVMSDDAALVWPLETGAWQATPLPSWGVLNGTTAGPTSTLRQLDQPVPVHAVVRLYQAGTLSLDPLPPVTAAPLIYRALCEYPAAFLADPDSRRHFFRTAARLARQLPCWRLDLPLHAPVWIRLEALLPEFAA